MTPWQDLRATIEAARAERRSDWLNGLIVQVKRAAALKICAPFEVFRIKKTGRTIEVAPRKDGVTMKTKKRDVPAIALRDIAKLDDAKLAFSIGLQADEKRIAQYTLSVVGTERLSRRPWYVRVDLDPEQRGAGPCSHAMLHGHIGADPGDGGAQESRLPLPWLDPDQALAWVFATLDQRLEP